MRQKKKNKECDFKKNHQLTTIENATKKKKNKECDAVDLNFIRTYQ
jgi:hypothetical protein